MNLYFKFIFFYVFNNVFGFKVPKLGGLYNEQRLGTFTESERDGVRDVHESSNGINDVCVVKSSLEDRDNSCNDPVIAIVGRPNVGKSAIFNRITKLFHRGSIVSDISGTTRDRQYSVADWNGKYFRIIDTGGFDNDEQFSELIKAQINEAINEASVVIVVVDGQEGITRSDVEIRDYIFKRLGDKPNLKVYLCVNKCESYRLGPVLAEQFWKLGLGKPYPTSALHGNGIGELLDECVKNFNSGTLPINNNIIISFVGRQNSGKSSIINKLIGYDRCIVSSIPGTTQDSTNINVTYDGTNLVLIDTAGMKLLTKDRRSYLSQRHSLKSIRSSDVCIMVIDANWGISKNDLKIAEEISKENKAAIIICNKWDLVNKDPTTYNNAVKYVKDKLHWLKYAEVILASAKTGQRINEIYDLIKNAYDQYCSNLPTTILNHVLKEATFTQPPKPIHGRILNIYYCVQVHNRPPGIVLYCNDDRLLSDDYKEYLELFFRKSLRLHGTPIVWYPRAKRERNVIHDFRNRNKNSNKYDLLTL